MSRRSAIALACAAPLGACTTLPQDGPITAQRPILSSDTATVPERSLELESGLTIGPDHQLDTPTTVKLGAGPATEVFLQASPFKRIEAPGDDPSGFGDLFLGLRHRFLDDRDGYPSAALQTQVKVPTAEDDDGLGTGEVDVSLAGIVTWHRQRSLWTAFLQIHRLGDPAGGHIDHHDVGFLAALLPKGRFGAFAEIGGSFAPEENVDAVAATVGATYNPGHQLVWDLAFSAGLTDDAPDWQASVGFTQGLGRIGRRPRRSRLPSKAGEPGSARGRASRESASR